MYEAWLEEQAWGMTPEQMMDDVIAARGHEDPVTIWFCGITEEGLEHRLLVFQYVGAMTAPVDYMENDGE